MRIATQTGSVRLRIASKWLVSRTHTLCHTVPDTVTSQRGLHTALTHSVLTAAWSSTGVVATPHHALLPRIIHYTDLYPIIDLYYTDLLHRTPFSACAFKHHAPHLASRDSSLTGRFCDLRVTSTKHRAKKVPAPGNMHGTESQNLPLILGLNSYAYSLE